MTDALKTDLQDIVIHVKTTLNENKLVLSDKDIASENLVSNTRITYEEAYEALRKVQRKLPKGTLKNILFEKLDEFARDIESNSPKASASNAPVTRSVEEASEILRWAQSNEESIINSITVEGSELSQCLEIATYCAGCKHIISQECWIQFWRKVIIKFGLQDNVKAFLFAFTDLRVLQVLCADYEELGTQALCGHITEDGLFAALCILQKNKNRHEKAMQYTERALKQEQYRKLGPIKILLEKLSTMTRDDLRSSIYPDYDKKMDDVKESGELFFMDGIKEDDETDSTDDEDDEKERKQRKIE